MAPPRFRRLAQFPITSRRTWPTNPTQRASCTTSSRAAEKAHQWYHERPFALFVTVRPFARVRQSYAKSCTSSRSDLMTFRILWQTCHRRGMFWFRPLFSCFILACFGHSLCATPLTNTTSWREKKRMVKQHPSITKVMYKNGKENEFKTMYGCIVESHESTRHRTESLLSKTHEDRIAWKGFTSMTHCNLVHKFIPMPQAMKIPNAKAAVEKEWQKARDNSIIWLKKIPKQGGGNSWSTKRQHESPLCYTDDPMSPEECGVRTEITEVQRLSRALGRHCKRRLWIPRSLYRTRLVYRRWLLQKSWMLLQDYQVVKDKPPTQYLHTLR